ncbi:MAG: hypothetical protein ACLSB9_14275 [Hydrogeniiclostridium mannosilyticum]
MKFVSTERRTFFHLEAHQAERSWWKDMADWTNLMTRAGYKIDVTADIARGARSCRQHWERTAE